NLKNPPCFRGQLVNPATPLFRRHWLPKLSRTTQLALSKQKREIEAVEAKETEARNLTAAVETQTDVEAEMAVRRSMV
ncbi:hypothetical protein A2U01_0093347, partial [Trifolium medium]|nr:hypothetical protein [Trifolium medium]